MLPIFAMVVVLQAKTPLASLQLQLRLRLAPTLAVLLPLRQRPQPLLPAQAHKFVPLSRYAVF